jgi:hypothetical protein
MRAIIKKAKDSYKYYLTKFSKESIIIVQKIKELVSLSLQNYSQRMQNFDSR